MFFYGFESKSERVLERFNRGRNSLQDKNVKILKCSSLTIEDGRETERMEPGVCEFVEGSGFW